MMESASPQKIPKSWMKWRLKYAVSVGRAGGSLIKGTMSPVPEPGLFPGYSASGQDVWVEESHYRSTRGIVVSAVGARCGKCFRADGDWSAIANTMVLLPRRGFCRDYLWYLFNDEIFWEKGGTAQPYVRFDASLDREWYFPPLDEQILISKFLDSATAGTNALIAKYERLIELLEEKRAALITLVVTKGLDPNVPMRDSGELFFGDIPAHWQVLPLRRLMTRFVDYRGSTPVKTESGVTLVTAANVKRGLIDYDCSQEFMAEEDYESWMVRGFPEVGDVLLTMEAPLGQVAQVDKQRIGLAQRVMLMKVDGERVRPDYLMWAILSSAGQAELLSRATGSTALGIKASKLRELPFAVPPIDEQRQIADTLFAESKKIDELQSVLRKALVLVREHALAIVASAVTGQIDVRKYQPSYQEIGA